MIRDTNSIYHNPFALVLNEVEENSELEISNFHKLVPPFTYFGGKRRVADEVWTRFGYDVENYIEPFAGGLSVLLARNLRGVRQINRYRELVNDSNCLLMNFWRAVTFGNISIIAKYADYPSQESELILWREELFCHEDKLRKALQADLSYYDDKLAGMALYIMRNWIGGNCLDSQTEVLSKMPRAIRSGWDGITPKNALNRLKNRLKNVITFCDDWKTVVSEDWLRPLKSNTQTTSIGTTAVFLDPPYLDSEKIYGNKSNPIAISVAEDVRSWALKNGQNPSFRIAYCGYQGQPHDEVFRDEPGWTFYLWKGKGFAEETKDEIIWFSPHCIPKNGG